MFFWLSPALADSGKASYDGLRIFLSDEFTGTFKEKLKQIFLANPQNVVGRLKDYMSSKKICPILAENLKNNPSEIQKHFICLFLIFERPVGWDKVLFDYMNKLHVNSFYLGDINSCILHELEKGFITKNESTQIKVLLKIVDAKISYAPKGKKKPIPQNMIVSSRNELPVDKIISYSKKFKLNKK